MHHAPSLSQFLIYRVKELIYKVIYSISKSVVHAQFIPSDFHLDQPLPGAEQTHIQEPGWDSGHGGR